MTRWIADAGVLFVIVTCTRLGFWQLSRYEERSAIAHAREQAHALPPLTSLDPLPDAADYRRIALQGRTSRETRVGDVMTADLVTVSPEETVDRCLATMTERKIRHLPVLRDGELLGVVSIGDLVRARLEEAVDEAEGLKHFVTGGYTG